MSLSKEKDDEDPNELAMPLKFQDELVYVIHTSLNNIATQMNNLNKHAGNILGELSKEVDKVSHRYNALQKRVAQLTDDIASKDTIKESSLQDTKPKASQSTCIQTEQMYCSRVLPAEMQETHDASVQTLPFSIPVPYCEEDSGVLVIPYCQDNTGSLMIPHYLDDAEDTSYYFETCKEMTIPEIKEQEQEKHKQKKEYLDDPNELKIVPQVHVMENDVTMGHIQPACREISHLHVDQPTECSSYSPYPFRELSQVLTRAVGKVLSSPQCQQNNGTGDLKNSLPYVSYGIGKGEEITPQPPTRVRPKIQVFVSPTAPASPPPLPPDWLALLRAPKMTTPTLIKDSPTQFPSPILTTSIATSIPDCLQTTPEADIPIAASKGDFSPLMSKPHQYYEMITPDLIPQDEERGVFPPMSPLVTTHRVDSKDTVSDVDGYTAIAQLPTLLYPTARPPFAPSRRPSVPKSPRLSVLTIQKSPTQPPKRYASSLPKSSSTALPRNSTSQTSQNSVSPPGSSCSQASRPALSSSRYTFDKSPRSSVPSVSRWSDAQSPRFSVASSGKPSVAQSAGPSNPAQQRSSSFKSTKPFNPQSLVSFPQSPSSNNSCPQTLSALQSSPTPGSPGTKRVPSIPPIFSKARSALMDAIRKGVLRRTEDHCTIDAQIEISKK